MAIKKRPADEDDDDDDEEEERPRRKRRDEKAVARKRGDDDDEDEEDEDDERPRRRRRPSDEEDEDDEEEPRGRGRRRSRRRDEEEEEEDEADEDEEGEEEDDDDKDKRPRKKKARGDKDEEPDGKDDPYQAWIKKQNVKRQQLLNTGEALKMYRLRARVHMGSVIEAAGSVGLVFAGKFLFGDMVGNLFWVLVGGGGLAITVGVPLLGIFAVRKIKTGTPKIAENSLLTVDVVLSIVIMVLYGAAAAVAFLMGPTHNASLVSYGLAFAVYHVSFIVELNFLRDCAQILKDKPQVKNAKHAASMLLLVTYVGLPIVGVAAFLLSYMGTPGVVLIGALALVWMLMYAKGFATMKEVCTLLDIAIAKKVAIMDKPDW